MRPNAWRVRMCVFLLVGFGLTLWLPTQFIAYYFDYSKALGHPWFFIGKSPVYAPFMIIIWTFEYGAIYSELFQKTLVFWLCFLSVVMTLVVWGSVYRLRATRVSNTYGSARWARPYEVQKMYLDAKVGVVLGEQKKVGILRHDGAEHIIVNAPTRSGKGVGVVIPTLLTWSHSVLVLDIKKENWSVTSGFRKQFSHTLCFDPTSNKSACWNPLLEVRKGEQEIRDVQNIADMLVDPDGSTQNRSHWEKTGHALLVATILHVLYSEEDKTLSGVATFLADPKRSIAKTLHYMLNSPHKADRPHPVIASTVREMLNKSENELSGVLSTAMSFLGLYRDPIVARNTSRCDFRIMDLMNAPYPVSLYVVVPPSDLSRTKSLIRLLLNMAGRKLTEHCIGASGSPHHHRLLLLLDEFPSLGRLDFFETALAFLAGYGIKCLLICQSFSQLNKLYGQDNAILDNCHIRVVMAPNDEKVAKRISDMLGQKTQSRYQVNFTGHRLAPWLSHVAMAQQETGRALLNPDEIMKLDPKKLLILVAGAPPVMANKIRYYQNALFQKRLLPDPEFKSPDRPPEKQHDWVSSVLSKKEKETLEKSLVPSLTEEHAEQSLSPETEAPVPEEMMDTSEAVDEKTDPTKELDADLDFYNGNDAQEIVL